MIQLELFTPNECATSPDMDPSHVQWIRLIAREQGHYAAYRLEIDIQDALRAGKKILSIHYNTGSIDPVLHTQDFL